MGAVGDNATGTLEIDPLDAIVRQPGNRFGLTTVATSRTYSRSANGTFGQFVPAIPIARYASSSPRRCLCSR